MFLIQYNSFTGYIESNIEETSLKPKQISLKLNISWKVNIKKNNELT